MLQGLLSLTKKHASRRPGKSLRNRPFARRLIGCGRSGNCSSVRRRKQEPLPFLEEHPIIRPLDDYAQVVARAIHRQQDRPSVGEGFTRHGSGVRRCRDNEQTAPAAQATRAVRRLRRALDPDIPRRVAPLQSPTPFHQTVPP